MPEITEGNLAFRFPDTWSVSKFDEGNGFAKRNFGHDAKMVDILALGQRPPLILIEIKDFRRHAIENKERMKTEGNDPVHLEVARKVRDTLSILVAAYRSADEDLSPYCHYLFGNAKGPVEAILFLEEDEIRAKTATGHRDRPGIERNLKKQLKMYQIRCLVQRRRTMPEQHPWSVASLNMKGE
jgi:hypothetical protein